MRPPSLSRPTRDGSSACSGVTLGITRLREVMQADRLCGSYHTHFVPASGADRTTYRRDWGEAACSPDAGGRLTSTRTAGDVLYVYQAAGRDRIPPRIRAQPRLLERYTRAIGEEDGGVRATWLPTTTARGRPTTS